MPHTLSDAQLAQDYLPLIYFDENETIPLDSIGYTVVRHTAPSPSFRRVIEVPGDALCVIEYAYFWLYDIQHMYDLEHIWVTVDKRGGVKSAMGSFHGRYLMLYDPAMPFAKPPCGTRIHAFCQPGKHAFLPDGALFSLIPDYLSACNINAGGGVLVGGPYEKTMRYTQTQNELSTRYIRARLTFSPAQKYRLSPCADVPPVPWHTLYLDIPKKIALELERIANEEHV